MHSPAMQSGNSERNRLFGEWSSLQAAAFTGTRSRAGNCLPRVYRTNTDSAGFVIGCAAGVPL